MRLSGFSPIKPIPGVDDDHRQAGLVEMACGGLLITPGGFDGDHLCLRPKHRQGWGYIPRLIFECFDAFRIVGEAPETLVSPEG